MADENETPAEEMAEAAADAAPEAAADPAPDAAAPEAAAPEADVSDDAEAGEADSSAAAAAAAAEKALEAAQKKLLKPAKDARYNATGKRKTSVARVILTPGKGTFWINGRELDDYFPRNTLRTHVLEPFVLTGAASAYHVRARIHGGGVSAQAHALRHGIAKALSEIDPAIRAQLKGKGMLRVDTRQVERKKAGLKKARKRPQFSKR